MDFASPGFRAQVSYGGFWIRVVASVIDSVLVLIVNLTINAALQTKGLEFALNNVCGVLYYAALEASPLQATLGKWAFGLVVTDLDGNRISFGRAIGRELAKIVSALILLAGFIMVGLTEKKQGLHDMIAGTLVVRKG